MGLDSAIYTHTQLFKIGRHKENKETERIGLSKVVGKYMYYISLLTSFTCMTAKYTKVSTLRYTLTLHVSVCKSYKRRMGGLEYTHILVYVNSSSLLDSLWENISCLKLRKVSRQLSK